MIVSHRHRFIFVKTHKTAGSSVEVALSRHCGPDDILTPMLAEEEAIRAQPGYRGPQHFLLPWTQHRPRDIAWAILRGRRRTRYYNHLAARYIRRHVGEDVWKSYYKFTIERNPWDKVVSAFEFHGLGERGGNLERWVLRGKAAHFSDWHLYSDDEGRLMVDHVCRFENLAGEMSDLGERLGLPEPLVLPHTKKKGGGRPDRRELFTDAMRERIAADFAREIAHMGYEF